MKTKENQLFLEWKEIVKEQSPTAIFVTDGVVDEEVWNHTKIKVLYLLKEVNGADEEWDERDYLKNYNVDPTYVKTHSPTIDTLIKWQFGINNGKDIPWDKTEKMAMEKNTQTSMLEQICLVNIKKTAGGGIVNWEKFDAYFTNQENQLRLKKQLDFYSPNVVICGGTAWHLCQIKGWNYDEWSQTKRGVRYFKDDTTVYLDFCHPNNRGPKNMIYYALLDALEELDIIEE